jgi:hypothetical protein
MLIKSSALFFIKSGGLAFVLLESKRKRGLYAVFRKRGKVF